ncbi:MAG: transposase [Bacteroidales bacterium]|nr:transposase [Bacteroidales bacterium]
MIGKLDKNPQLDIFRLPLRQRVRKNHDLVKLAASIKWDKISSGLAENYSPNKGRKGIPVRKMAGLLILKYLYGGSDNSILRVWLDDPAVQYFCGEVWFSDKPAVNRSDLVNFRRRIKEKGMEIIFYPELLQTLNAMKNGHYQSFFYPSPRHWNFLRFFRSLMPGGHVGV